MELDWQAPDYDAVVAERVARLKAIREDPKREELLAGLKAFYLDNPAAFISDWGFTFDPRRAEEGKSTQIPFVLFPRQAEYINWLLDRWRNRENGLVEKSRDMGITWLCVGFAVWMWTFHSGSVAGFGSRKEDLVDKIGDPDSIFWKVRFFIDMLPPEFKPEGYRSALHAPYMRVTNPENGSVIKGEAGDNIGRGGRASIHFLDEAAHIEHDMAVEAALSQNANVRIDVSTPNGPGNLFYRKRHGGKIRVFVFDWRQDPRKGPEWYEKQRNDLDAVTLAQEVDRNYEGSVDDAYIPGPIVDAAMRRGPADVAPIGRLRVGVDPARFGNDKSVISFRRGRVLIKQERKGQLDNVQCASWVKNEVLGFLRGSPGLVLEQIAVDTIGVGAGVADVLRTDGYFPDLKRPDGSIRKIVVDVNASLQLNDGECFNLRARMARDTRDWLKAEASIPNDVDLKSAITCFRYKFKAGLLLCEDKDAVKKRLGRSPDEYDSLALTFAIPTMAEEPPPRVTIYEPAVPGVGM